MNVILWLILLALIFEYFCHAYPCLTWELQQKELKLVFKTNDFATSVSFHDNYGTERGFCDFNTSCHNILYEKEKRQVVLKLVILSDINGKWSCQQGSDNFSTHISTGDISKSTNLKMRGSILHRKNKTFVQVECASCREPYRNQVHYLLNKRYGEIVSYQSNSTICTNNNGECRGSICSCSPFGNLFTRAFERDGDNTMTFSCAMKFSTALQDFVKVSHLVYDGKDGFTFTEIQDSSPTKDVPSIVTTVPSTTEGMDIWIILGNVFAAVFLIPVILICCYLVKMRCKDNVKKNKEETVLLRSIMTDSNNANNNDFKRWIVLQILLHGIASERLRVYVRNFVKLLFNVWEEKVHIKSQSFPCHIIDYQHKIKLNYSAINSNAGKSERNMDYNVGNFIDFSKLFLPTSLTGYTEFNSGCKIESLLELINQISEFPLERRVLAEELMTKVLKPYKHKNNLDVNEYEAAIGTTKRFIKCMDWDRDTDLDIYDKHGVSVIDQQFINDMQLPSGSDNSFEDATYNFMVKCQSIQEKADGHSGQLVENLADKRESIATRPTEHLPSMALEQIINIESNKMKQVESTTISNGDHDLVLNDEDERECEITKFDCTDNIVNKDYGLMDCEFNESKRTEKKMTIMENIKKIYKDFVLFKDNEEEKRGKIDPQMHSHGIFPEASTAHLLSSNQDPFNIKVSFFDDNISSSTDSSFQSCSSSYDPSVHITNTDFRGKHRYFEHMYETKHEVHEMSKEAKERTNLSFQHRVVHVY